MKITLNSIKKRVLLTGGLFLSVLSANADNSNTSGLTPEMLQPQFSNLTPEAASLGRYGAFQVSEYSGAANISIPLYTVKSGDVSFPITLYYDATGIKVEQDATFVGLGWNLSYGGMISHIICGEDDFRESITYKNYWQNYWKKKIPSISQDQPCQSLEFIISPMVFLYTGGMGDGWGPAKEDEYNFYNDVAKGYDSPDIFNASFCGQNISFVIDKRFKASNGQDSVVILNDNSKKYKISYTIDSYPHSFPSSFTITDDRGISYVFSPYREHAISSLESADSYYMTKIYGTDGLKGKNVIIYEYDHLKDTKDVCFYTGRPRKKFNYSNAKLNKSDHNELPLSDPAFSDQYYRLTGKNGGHTPVNCNESGWCDKVYPKRIITALDTIEFKRGKRNDILDAYCITGITIKSKVGSAQRNISFAYDYFNETPAAKEMYSNSHKRLKLTGVTIDGQKYKFIYDNKNLPSYESYSKDYWGYYNGASNGNEFVGCTPAYIISNGMVKQIEHLEGSNRLASEKLCNVGMLKRIIYPTGGYTDYEFEANRFNDKYYYPDASNSKISFPSAHTENDGTLNVGDGTINVCGTMTNTLTVKACQTKYDKYDITISAILKDASDNLIVTVKDNLGSVVKSVTYWGSRTIGETISLSLTPDVTYTIEAKLTAIPANSSSTLATCNVTHDAFDSPTTASSTASPTASPSTKNENGGYSIGGGLRIKTIKNYDSDNTYLNGVKYEYSGGKLLSPTVQLEKHYVSFSYDPISWTTTNGLEWKAQRGNQTYPYFSFYYANTEPSYPYYCSVGIPATVGYDQVVKKEIDKNGNVLRKTVLDFHNFSYVSEDGNTNAINSKMQNAFFFNSYCTNNLAYAQGHLNGRIKQETIYNGTVLASTTRYEYESVRQGSVVYPKCYPNHLNGFKYYEAKFDIAFYRKFIVWSYLKEKTETLYDKNGKQTTSNTTSFKYNPTNYQLSDLSVTDGTNTSRTLYSYPASNTLRFMQHNLSEVDGVETYRNGTFTGGSKYIFKVHKNPQTGASFSVVQKCNSVLPNASKSNVTEMTVTSYDDYGNIREYKKKDGTPVTVIWSYNYQFPIMEIVGKTYDQVKAAYSSITSLEGKSSVAETTMSSIHATLRKNLPDALVTAYTYSPWQSVSQIIKPNGEKTVYSYDSYGRLTTVLDANQSTFQPILKYNYNYKNK